ncbi:TPA: restriction endonuclease subunit S [Photobacterium damselae]
MSELPKGWVKIPLDQVATWGSGGTPKRSEPSYYGGDVPWVKTGDLGPKYLKEASEYISQLGLEKSSAKLFPRGSVAIAMYGATIGKTSTLDFEASTNQACAVGNPIDGVILTDFLYYFLTSEKQSFIKKGKGGAQPNISQQLIKAHEINLPSLPEQKRIVEKLDEVLAQVDTIKARLDGIPAILKRFRQSVLAAAVSGKLIDLNETKITTIGEVSEDIRYGTSKKCDYKGGSTPVIRIPNIGDRKLDTSDLKLADFTERELEKLALKTGDLLVIRSNGSLELVAKPALVEPQYEGFLYAGYLIRIRCDREKILPSFLLNVLSSRVVRDVVELGARSTSGVNNINSKELSALEFVLPSISEQKEIVRLVDQYFAFADAIEAQVKKAQARVDNLTQSILAKAFRGELVEQDPNDEPADKLLERIAVARKEAEALAKAAKKAQSTKSVAKKKMAKSA